MIDRIVISSDHAGFDLKCHLKPFIESLGYEVVDVGTFSKEPVDYPEYTFKAAQKVVSSECSRGIVFCGTGQGDAIVANKVPGIRAALCWNEFTARMSRAHNDANVLVIGGWVTGHKVAEEIVRIWLTTPFEGGRHERRVNQIADIEREMMLKRSKVYDVTRVIEPGMLVWPGDSLVELNKVQLEGVASMTHLSFSAHTGTHVDAPAHFISGGKGIAEIDLDKLMGIARVCQIPEARRIDQALLSSLNLRGVSRLLLGTANAELISKREFDYQYVSLTEDAAIYLVEKGIKFLAVDYLSVDKFDSIVCPVHKILLSAGVAIVEGVKLTGIPTGDYELLCLPIKLGNSDGAPARVILRSL